MLSHAENNAGLLLAIQTRMNNSSQQK